jgi:hypothetical protein
MRLEVDRYALKIIPSDVDELDTAYIEDTLGLKKDGDSIQLVRVNSSGLLCIAYLKTVRDGSK